MEIKKRETQQRKDEKVIPVLQPMAEDKIREIENILGYEFAEKMLLAEAFMHAPFNNQTKKAGKSYKRLEFLGHDVLSCLVARELFNCYEDLSPGRLTLLRAANVDRERLARIVMKNDLYRFIRHKAPQVDWQIQEFMTDVSQYPIHSNGLLDPPKALADIMKSVIGAIFIDSNSCLETVWKTFKKLAEPLINLDTLGRHPISELYELCQKNKMNVSFDKNKWRESRTVEAFVDGNLYGSGTCHHKKEIAQNRAAKIALDRLKLRLKKKQIDSCCFHLFIQRFNLFLCFTLMDTPTVEKEMEIKKRETRQRKDEEVIPILQPMAEDKVREIENILGYEFAEKMLLAEAFTHTSFNNLTKNTEKSYERLEFMGDAVLGCLMARELFNSYESLSPGRLMLLKVANVDTERLARIVMKNDLHRFIRHKAPQLDWKIEEFMTDITQYPIHSNGLIDSSKALADIMESIIGAVFVDSNSCLETVSKTFKKLAEPLINLDTLGRHPVSELYELCQKNKMNVSFDKNTWRKSRTVEAFIDGTLYGSGTCSHKKEIAQNQAAKIALDRLKLKLDKTN